MIDLRALQPWLERESHATDCVAAPLAARMAALLDQPEQGWSDGDAIPASWYVMLFGPTQPQSTLGADGHPPKGGLLPPVPWPRRMFAGRRVGFEGALRIGDRVTRHSRVTAITAKQGRSGPLCLVTLRHTLHTARGLAVTEEQDVVYRPAPPPGGAACAPSAAPHAAPPREAAGTRTLVPDNTLLFRYSAVAYNAHRIHYDEAYAREVEGYPGLVVNGGLSTLLLWRLAEHACGTALRRSATRNLRPLFAGRPLTLNVGQVQGGQAAAWVLDDQGAVAIEAELELA